MHVQMISGQPMAIRLRGVDVMPSNASNPVGAKCDDENQKNRILVHQGGKGLSCNE
jgi:hypothetical protein